MFLRLEGRACLVVGAGAVAEGKIRGLLDAGARVRVIAPSATAVIAELAHATKLEWQRREFRVRDVAGMFLVVAATSSADVHERIWRAARRADVLCNVVDEPERCDFFYGAVVRRGALQIVVSTGGRSPALAQRIRKRLEKQFGGEYAEWIERLGRARSRLLKSDGDILRRKQIAHRMAREICLPRIARARIASES
ncbi:MAG TPA: bifunctional precorrin-2 dehydrogenase/sirohydrochlorin ferrochelatase [Candidatus Acidoferrales bacterium]